MARRKNDPASIEPLFRAHFDAIYRYAACRVGRDVALDVAAETFAQALRNIATLDPDRDARAWLFGIATNVVRHHRRAERRRIRAYATAASQMVRRGDEEWSPTAARERIVDALAELDARDRDTLLLYAWADLSYEEISAALAIPVGTVRSRIHRARRLLRTSAGHDIDCADHAAVVALGEEL